MRKKIYEDGEATTISALLSKTEKRKFKNLVAKSNPNGSMSDYLRQMIQEKLKEKNVRK